MTDTVDTATWIMRTLGASREDAERVMQRVADEAIAYYLASQSLPEPEPEPQSERPPVEIHVHLTLDGNVDRAVNTAAARVMREIVTEGRL